MALLLDYPPVQNLFRVTEDSGWPASLVPNHFAPPPTLGGGGGNRGTKCQISTVSAQQVRFARKLAFVPLKATEEMLLWQKIQVKCILHSWFWLALSGVKFIEDRLNIQQGKAEVVLFSS